MSRISTRQRSSIAQAILDIDIHWARTFQAVGLYPLMPNVSPRTAVKYVQRAIDSGFILEFPDACDRRARMVIMSDKVLADVERFLDYTKRRFRDAALEAAD